MRTYLICLCFLFIMACHSNRQTADKNQETPPSSIESLAAEKFESNYLVVDNEDAKYSIVKSKTKSFEEFGFDISYFLYDHDEQKIIFEDFLKSGYVDWQDTYTIKAINRKVQTNGKRSKEIYLFDVKKKEKLDVN